MNTPLHQTLPIRGMALALKAGWKTIVLATLLAGALGVFVAMVVHPVWRIQASLVPESPPGNESDALRGVPSIRSLGLGALVGGNSTGLTLEAYPQLLTSREVLRRVVLDTLRVNGTPVRLVDLLGSSRFPEWVEEAVWSVQPGTPSEVRREDRAIRALGSSIRAQADLKTGLLRFSMRTKDPDLGLELSERVIEHFRDVVQAIYGERSRRQVAFLQDRTMEARRELYRHENVLASFSDRNMDMFSARFTVDRDRLQRNVTRASEMVLELERQLAVAEFEEQRSTPVVSTIEPLQVPLRPEGIPRGAFPVLFGLLGIVAGAGWVLWRASPELE